MKAALHLTVRGRVQGVGYRYYTQHSAAALGITGFVRNLTDGNVEIIAEGEPAALDELVHIVKEGPGFSFVDGVDIKKIPVEGTFLQFSIKY